MHFFARLIAAAVAGFVLATPLPARVVEAIPYKAEGTLGYESERCRLDLYLPAQKSGFPTLVWFYGGGMTGGGKNEDGNVRIANAFARAGIAVAMVDYRLSPQARYPAYVEDAAAAFAWVCKNISQYGGDPKRVFIGGHSAGAYLSSMVAMDERYLRAHGLDQKSIAGVIPVSGQMMTHFTVRKERGIPEQTIIADEAAPIYYTRADTPPFLILFGDHDWPARLEENQYFVAAQKAFGNKRVALVVIKNRDHGSIAAGLAQPGDPAATAIVKFVQNPAARPPQ